MTPGTANETSGGSKKLRINIFFLKKIFLRDHHTLEDKKLKRI